MYFLLVWVYISVSIGENLTDTNDHVRLAAITDTFVLYPHNLYLNEGNRDPPSELDLAAKDPFIRLQLCENITKSHLFELYHKIPVNVEEAVTKLRRQKFLDVFHLIYQCTDLENPEYKNPFVQRQFEVFSSMDVEPILKTEYVFTCLLADSTDSDDIHPLFVSKAYNTHRGLHVHRFLFPEKRRYQRVMLAEQSAKIYKSPGFEVELHYLELRKLHEPELTCRLDPVCKLNLGNVENNQLFRLCAIIFTSPFFEGVIKYPTKVSYNLWREGEIAFRTDEGLTEASGKSYHEIMLACEVAMTKNEPSNFFYISRAYNPNQVFIYTQDRITKKFYIENLSTDVSIVHEPYNFGEVET